MSVPRARLQVPDSEGHSPEALEEQGELGSGPHFPRLDPASGCP